MPKHAILVDLSVDPYLPNAHPPVVRGIEGIPRGNLDKFIFHPGDPDWEETITQGVPSQFRRTTVTCYSWPGFHPEACMVHYAQQLTPILPVLFEKGYDDLNLKGDILNGHCTGQHSRCGKITKQLPTGLSLHAR